MNQFLKRAWAEIDLDAIHHNFCAVRAAVSPSAMIMAVVKADAYGHGVRHVAEELAQAGADWFGVSTLAEALQLRRYGFLQPILILGYTPPEQAEALAKEHITQALFSKEYARRLSQCAAAVGVEVEVHVKVDVGMGRIGFPLQNNPGVEEEIRTVCRLPGIRATGIFTHFPSADLDGDEDGTVTEGQFTLFTAAIERLKQLGIVFSVRHCCNSAAALCQPHMHLDMVRAGIVLYGLSPSPALSHSADLQPAMSLKSAVSMVKELPAGATVSYGRTYRAGHNITAATVCLGYADGYLRSLSNRAQMLVHGQRAPLIGRVCMDQLMLDVSGIEGVKEGTTATAFGRDGTAVLPADELAALAGTINYELTCLVSKRVPRVYLKGGKIVDVADYLAEH